MLIQKNRVVALNYRLTEGGPEGELIEETFNADPLKFIFGMGMMLPSFEENLEEKTIGDSFSFTLEPENAYGTFEEEAVVEIPIGSFADETGNVDRDRLQKGNPLQMMDQEGRSYRGIVLDSKLESVVVDFNHPMAGRTLHFTGEILEVREATDSEIDHGHVH
ncbi:MAG: peptidylprolyl isomerase [Saprospiraceae bacterium]|nr:peptidylprolyl isomerase [Saprospiraceae bacterium]